MVPVRRTAVARLRSVAQQAARSAGAVRAQQPRSVVRAVRRRAEHRVDQRLALLDAKQLRVEKVREVREKASIACDMFTQYDSSIITGSAQSNQLLSYSLTAALFATANLN